MKYTTKQNGLGLEIFFESFPWFPTINKLKEKEYKRHNQKKCWYKAGWKESDFDFMKDKPTDQRLQDFENISWLIIENNFEDIKKQYTKQIDLLQSKPKRKSKKNLYEDKSLWETPRPDDGRINQLENEIIKRKTINEKLRNKITDLENIINNSWKTKNDWEYEFNDKLDDMKWETENDNYFYNTFETKDKMQIVLDMIEKYKF